jgi:sulfite oxidase
MLVQSVRPEDLEMPVSGFSAYITPLEHFFVRSHVYTPVVNLSEWRLKVEGAVKTPLVLTMQDVRALPAVELVSVLECAGNGRAFYKPRVPGLQWQNGAVGNGRWRGVRAADVLKRAAILDSAKEILLEGADVPIGTMPDFQRSIPLAKAMDANTILAYEMNGETITREHGFPLRVVVPGWAGDSWLKWLTAIYVLEKEHDGFWMKNAYRHPGKPLAPGTVIPPEQMRPVTSLQVKSVIIAPENGQQVGVGKPVTIRGVAWSGDAGAIADVQVSTDAGRSWKAAVLRPDQRTAFGWRQWQLNWTPVQAAYYTILARARDAAGNTQPLEQEWNPSGYLWNVVPRIGVNVVAEPSVKPKLPDAISQNAIPPSEFKNACLVCHNDAVIRQQRLTRSQWEQEMNKMIGWGAKVRQEDRGAFLDFLFNNYGPLVP